MEVLRMCIVCRQMKDKRTLIRIVKNPQGIFIDKSGKMSGRGAYVCADTQCITLCKKQHRLEKSFKCEVSSELYDSLLEEKIEGKN